MNEGNKMNGWMDGWMDGWMMDGWIGWDGWDGWMDGLADG